MTTHQNDKMHWKLKIEQSLLALQGPKSTLVLEKLFTSLPEKPNAVVQQEVEGNLFVIIKKTLTGEEGFILCYPSELKDKFLHMNGLLLCILNFKFFNSNCAF